MATVYVNDKPVDIGNQKLNLIQAADLAGVKIPSYCWHAALTVVASCRMCLVEVGERKPDGSVTMQPKVLPGCQTPAKDGTVIVTNSPKTRHAQMQTLESLLVNHPLDCPVCDKAGECLLQDYSFEYGRAESRMIDVKRQPPNKPHIGEHITLFTDRCIMCSRCVRFTREISGTAELMVVNRGDHAEIDVFPGQPCDNKLAGNVVDLCPVGALCNKEFLYKQRVWYLKTAKSVCANCSTGCSVYLDSNKDILYRLRPRYNPQAQGYFMCDEGRFGYGYTNSSARIRAPLIRGKDGVAQVATWDVILLRIRTDLAQTAAQGGLVAGVLSPFLTCEEAYLLCEFLKGLSGKTLFALGPVPSVGEDDTYPKDRRGNPTQPVKFTIRAEKCPNRLGVEAVLRHFQGEVIPSTHLLDKLSDVQAVYWAGGYRDGAQAPAGEQLEGLSRVPFLVVHDLFPTPLSEKAGYVLPGAAPAEKEGTVVNHAGLAQAIHWAVRPPRGCRTDGQVFLDLLERPGLVHAPTLRAEMARKIPAFAPLAAGTLPEHGVFLDLSAQS